MANQLVTEHDHIQADIRDGSRWHYDDDGLYITVRWSIKRSLFVADVETWETGAMDTETGIRDVHENDVQTYGAHSVLSLGRMLEDDGFLTE